MNPRKPLLALGACLALQACDTQIAGTNNETQTKGTFFQPGGAPDVGARVRIFQASNDSQPVRQTYVDAVGNASLTGLPHGYYSVLVQDTEGRASFLDSLYSDGNNLPAPPDTVRATATVIGHVQVQPMDSPAIAWIHLMRTGIYVNVDSTGAFRITGVPSDALTLVASTLLPQYTPTFRSIKPLPDSTVDVGTINLVYNGLPLVTGIAARYDSLSGVVTLTWKDTTYARKNGYLVYKGQGAQPSPSQIGTSTMASFSDTVFGGFGATPSRYDSAEFDLTYWVAAQANDFTTGPVWNKVQLHVKSPALAKRWTVTWAPTIPLTGGVSVDTIAGGLVVQNDTGMQILSPNGFWTQGYLPSSPQAENGPVYWKGKIWMVRGASISGTFKDSAGPGMVAIWNIYDSLRILSSGDGIHWDSSSIATGRDSVSGFRLHAGTDGLVLTASYQRANLAFDIGGISQALTSWTSVDGSRWSPWSGAPAFLSGLDGYQTNFENLGYWTATVFTNPNDSAWTLYSTSSFSGLPTTWLVDGESIDTTTALLKEATSLTGRASDSLMAFYDGSRLGLASPSSPSIWQTISTPEALQNYASVPPPVCFWQGKLVVLGASGIHIATIQ